MTLTARNLSLRLGLVVMVAAVAAASTAFVWAMTGRGAFVSADLTVNQLFAVVGAGFSTLLGFFFAAVYLRMFRRTPSLSVFFVIWFFLAMMFDVSKLGQVFVPASPWPQFAPLVARISIFGHIVGVMALFGAGLYAGGVRMQRHGTAMFVGAVIAFGLSWSIPIDTSALPSHLVYHAGMRASLQATLVLLLTIAVLNYVQAAVHHGHPRQLISALAVALMATGRELLFYQIQPVWILVGMVALIAGAIVFAGQNYRDFLVS